MTATLRVIGLSYLELLGLSMVEMEDWRNGSWLVLGFDLLRLRGGGGDSYK